MGYEEQKKNIIKEITEMISKLNMKQLISARWFIYYKLELDQKDRSSTVKTDNVRKDRFLNYGQKRKI